MKRRLRYFAMAILLGCATAHAEQAWDNTQLHKPASLNLQIPPLMLADAAPLQEGGDRSPPSMGAPEDAFDEPWFTGNKLHKYLGLGSIAFATLAVLSPKEEEGAHEMFARGAAALGGAAVASGLMVHLEDISVKGGLSDPDNQHALLATLGAIGFAVAVSEAPEEGHASAGAAGFVAMLIGIRLTW